jgi:hypothetical protein
MLRVTHKFFNLCWQIYFHSSSIRHNKIVPYSIPWLSK